MSKGRQAYNIVASWTHFAGRPLLLVDIVGDVFSVEELDLIEKRMREVALGSLAAAKEVTNDPAFKHQLAKFGSSVLNQLDQKV